MGYYLPQIQDAKVINFIIEPRFRQLRHLVLLIGLLTVLSFSSDVTEYRGGANYVKVLFVFIPLAIVCYFNMIVLVPLYFFRGKYLLYTCFLIFLSFLSLTFISYLINIYFPGSSDPRHFGQTYEGVVILTPIILITTMIKLFQRWMRDTQKISELNNINYKLELNELRNQMNPHFLFNMLNGIKSLVRTDPNKATFAILKLSEFLRYQLYENNEEEAILRSEIAFLTNFLELEKLRRDNLSVFISCETDKLIMNSIFIPPNLFTTFVENAVKHSVTIESSGSFIKLKFWLENHKLHFSCINSKDPAYISSSSDKNSGIGLENIKRRLYLLYADTYGLDITSSLTNYEVKLTIPL